MAVVGGRQAPHHTAHTQMAIMFHSFSSFLICRSSN
jgi:hypothetical protein